MIVCGPFSVFWEGFRGIFSISMVDLSDSGLGLVPRRSFRVSFPCFGGGVF